MVRREGAGPVPDTNIDRDGDAALRSFTTSWLSGVSQVAPEAGHIANHSLQRLAFQGVDNSRVEQVFGASVALDMS